MNQFISYLIERILLYHGSKQILITCTHLSHLTQVNIEADFQLYVFYTIIYTAQC